MIANVYLVLRPGNLMSSQGSHNPVFLNERFDFQKKL